MKNRNRSKVSNMITQMVLSALMLALGLVLPLLTGQIPQIGSALLPMHIPVLLAGFLPKKQLPRWPSFGY